MTKLTYQQRKKIPKSSFALRQKVKTKSGKTKILDRFPIGDKEHQRKAIQLAPKAKNITAKQEKMIVRKAKKKLYGKTMKPKGKK